MATTMNVLPHEIMVGDTFVDPTYGIAKVTEASPLAGGFTRIIADVWTLGRALSFPMRRDEIVQVAR